MQQEVTFLPRLLSNKREEEEEAEAAESPPLIGGGGRDPSSDILLAGRVISGALWVPGWMRCGDGVRAHVRLSCACAYLPSIM